MHCPQNGPVSADGPKLAEPVVEGVLIHRAEIVRSKDGADPFQLRRDRGVLVGQIGVIRPAGDQEQGVAVLLRVQLQLFHDGSGAVAEVHPAHAAHGAGRLIQQAAGLAEEFVLHALTEPCKLHGGQPKAVPFVEDLAQQDLHRGGRRQAAARQDRGGKADVQSAQRGLVRKHGDHTGDQGCGTARRGLVLPRIQGEDGGREALGEEAELPASVFGHGGDRIHVHAARQDQTVLMVGVVAAELRPAGGRKVPDLPGLVAQLAESPGQRLVPRPLARVRVDFIVTVFHTDFLPDLFVHYSTEDGLPKQKI